MSESEMITDCNENENDFIIRKTSVEINRLSDTLVENFLTEMDTEALSEEKPPNEQFILNINPPNEIRIECDPATCPKANSSDSEVNSEIYTVNIMNELEKSFNHNWSTLCLSTHSDEANCEPLPSDSSESVFLSKDGNISKYTIKSKPTEVEETPPKPLLTVSIARIPSIVHKSRIREITTIKFKDSRLLFSVSWVGLPKSFVTYETWSGIQNRKLIENFLKKNSSYIKYKMKYVSNRLMVGTLFTINNLNKLIGKVIDESFDDTLLDCYLYAYMKNKNKGLSPKIQKTIQRLLQKKVFINKRQAQKIDLQAWVRKINSIDTNSVIRIENDVDLKSIDAFQYIKERKRLRGYKLDENDSPVYCSCSPCNSRSGCCGPQNDSEFAYTLDKKLKQTGTAIYECNSNCKCGSDCANRVVQNGRTQNLCIYRTNGMGWGVKTENKIKTGVFICEYVGEVIYSDAAELRGLQYDGEGFTYLFDLDFDNSELYTLDGYRCGNVSRFINHSCDPNLEVCPTWVGCLDPNMPRLALFTNRDIEKGEQLTIDYKITFQNGDTDNASNILKRKIKDLQKRGKSKLSNDMLKSLTKVATSPINKCSENETDTSKKSQRILQKFDRTSESTTSSLISKVSSSKGLADNTDSTSINGIVGGTSSENKTISTRKSPRILSLSSKRLEIPKLNEYPKNLKSHMKCVGSKIHTIQRRVSRRSSSSSAVEHIRKRIRCLCKSANCRKYLF